MLNIRPATPADVPTILHFIRELAIFEREPDAVIATEADLLRDGFSLAPDGSPLDTPIRFRTLIAELTEAGATTPAGFALFFTSYSTWLGHHGIRLEDLYVTPALRQRGISQSSSHPTRANRDSRRLPAAGVGRAGLERSGHRGVPPARRAHADRMAHHARRGRRSPHTRCPGRPILRE